MAGPTVAERRGEEKALSAAEAQGLMATIDTQLEAARRFARQTALHLPTGGATAETVNAPLIKSLEKLNSGVRSYNPVKDASGKGRDFVEIPQATAVLDTAALDRIKMQVVLAANAPNRASLINEIISATPADTVARVPTRVDTTRVAAVDTTRITPKPVVQQLTQEERDNYQRIADNLDRIYQAAKGQTKTSALVLRDKIRPFINKTGATQAEVDDIRSTLKRLETQYNGNNAFATALKAVQDAELAKAPVAAGIAVREAPKHPLQQQLVETQTLLQRIPQGDQRRPLAEKIIDHLPDVWLLGEETKAGGKDNLGTGPRWEAYAMLRAAMVTLIEGNTEVADTNYRAAADLFAQEQALLGKRVDALKAEVDGGVSAIKASWLDDGSELLAKEKAEGIGSKDETKRFYRTSGRKIHNGREDIEAAMVNRQEQLAKLSQSKGRLSYQQVSDLEQTVRAEIRAVKSLIAFWQYAKSSGIEKTDAAERQGAWKHYGAAAATLADPDPATAVNVYNSYTKEMRDFLIAQYRKATGDNTTSEQKIIAALMRSPQWRYDDALYGVYQHVYPLAPQPAGELVGVVGAVSGLRAARVYYEDAYEQYVTMENKDPDQRLEDARFFLQNAADLVKRTGAQENDILPASAGRWLAAEEPKDRKGKEATADYMYNMAISMVAVREAEIWANNAREIGRPDISTDAITNAKQIAKTAKKEFEWYFSVPQAGEAYYPNLPRTVADGAIRLVAPDALETTDRHARYAALFWSAQKKENENTLRVDAEISGKDVDAAKLREAQLADRPAAMAAAQEAEEGHIRMVIACRASNDFARQPAPAGAEAYGLVSPNVGRRPLAIEAGRKRLTLDRADLHFDHQNVPHEEAAVYPQGSYWQEVARQKALKADDGAPKALRQLNTVPFSASVDTIARNYGKADSAQVQEANSAFIKLLDARIAELEERLNGSVEYKGKMVPIRLFGRSEDPRGYIVVSAQEALALAKNLRKQYSERAGTDLFNGSVRQTPKESILMVEIAIASLSDENFNFPPGRELEASLTPFVNRTAVQPITVPGYGTVSHGFFKADVMVASGEAKERRGESPSEYSARTGAELNLVYDWMFTSELRQDYFLVANPNLYQKGHDNEPAYVARIMRNMAEKLPDGRTAYPVIAARPPEKATQSESRSTTLDYELETNADGTYKILTYVTEKRGPEGRPIFVPASAEISEEARQRLFRTDCGATIAQPMAGDMQASVIVRQK